MKKNNYFKKFTLAILAAVTMLVTVVPVTAYASDVRDMDRHSRDVYWNEPGITQCKLSPDDIHVGGFYAMHKDVDGKLLHMGPFARYYLVHVIDIKQDGSNKQFLIENYSQGGTEWIKLNKQSIWDHFPGFGDSIKWLYKIDYVRTPQR